MWSLIRVLHSLFYYFADLERLFELNYIPNEQDIVRCRARTIGVTETRFNVRDYEVLVVDVGGQRSERRKWIHCFQDVTNILFVVSLSGYDQCLVEDSNAVRTRSPYDLSRSVLILIPIQNQMQDAMALWDSTCNSQWFRSTSIVGEFSSTLTRWCPLTDSDDER